MIHLAQPLPQKTTTVVVPAAAAAVNGTTRHNHKDEHPDIQP